MLGYFIFATGSLLAGVICLFLSGRKAYFGRVEKSYGEAAARKVTRSLKLWGYFLIITSGLLIVALVLEGGR